MHTDPSGHSWVSDVVGDFTEDVEDWVRDADPTEYFEDGIRATAEGPQEFVEFHERMSRGIVLSLPTGDGNSDSCCNQTLCWHGCRCYSKRRPFRCIFRLSCVSSPCNFRGR